MKLRRNIEFGTRQQNFFWREFDLKNAKFHLSRRAAIRMALWSVPFLFLAAAALHFEQPQMFWGSLVFGTFVTGWQVLAFGYFGESARTELKATNFYSKGTLIFSAIFWAVLILGVTIALYLKFPDS